MEFELHCNSLKCRALISDRAVVTTCSHIFCEQCSIKLIQPDNRHSSRICPACDSSLNNADDAVLTSLKPSEDYKTSIMSGLSPATILECASRGVMFFQYQATQELAYQRIMCNNLKERYHVLGSQMDSVIAEANAEIVSLREKLETSQRGQRHLEKKNAELVDAIKSKSSALNKLQGVYQASRHRTDAAAVEDAAVMDVEDALQSALGPNSFGQGPQRPLQAHMNSDRSPSLFANRRQPASESVRDFAGSSVRGGNTTSHRQRLGLSPYSNAVTSLPTKQGYGPAGSVLQPSPTRQPLCGIDHMTSAFVAQGGNGANTRRLAGLSANRGSAAGRKFGPSILQTR